MWIYKKLAMILQFAVSWAFLLTFLNIHSFCQDQDNGQEVLQKEVSINLKNTSLAFALEYLASNYQIPIGMEFQKNAGHFKTLNIVIPKMMLKDALNVLMPNESEYKWYMMKGRVNVSPKEQQYSLLDIKLKTFQVIDMEANEVLRKICSLSELQAKLKSLGLSSTCGLSGYTIETKPLKLSINVEDKTLRELLNEVLLVTGIWVTVIVDDTFFIRLS